MSYDFADRLIDMRRTRGLSQEELAKELGLSRQAISKWERAESAPDIGNLVALSEIYEVSLDELVHGAKTEGEANPLAEDADPNIASQDDGVAITGNESDPSFEEDEEEIVLKAEVLPMDGDSADSAESIGSMESAESMAASTVSTDDPFAINGKKAAVGDEPVFDTAAFFEEIEQDRIAPKPSGDAQTVQAAESNPGKSGSSQGATGAEVPTCQSAPSKGAAGDATPAPQSTPSQTTPPPPQEGTVWVMDSAEVPVHPVEKQKNPMLTFPYPVLIVLIYLVLGFGLGLWHPAWVLFLTIPFYYWIVNVIAHDPEYLRRHSKDPE